MAVLLGPYSSSEPSGDIFTRRQGAVRALAHIGRTISHGQRRIPVWFSTAGRFEAALAAFVGDHAPLD